MAEVAVTPRLFDSRCQARIGASLLGSAKPADVAKLGDDHQRREQSHAISSVSTPLPDILAAALPVGHPLPLVGARSAGVVPGARHEWGCPRDRSRCVGTRPTRAGQTGIYTAPSCCVWPTASEAPVWLVFGHGSNDIFAAWSPAMPGIALRGRRPMESGRCATIARATSHRVGRSCCDAAPS